MQPLWWKRISALLVSLTLTATAVRADTQITVLPLGDSITAGSEGGYRKAMIRQLHDDHAVTVTTFGSQTDDNLPKGQSAHEGHPGWRIDQLNDNLVKPNPTDKSAHGGYWLFAGDGAKHEAIKPDFVTLMAGINDLNQMIGDDPESPMTARSDEILKTLQKRFIAITTTLTDTLPEATILMGGCIPYNNGLLNQKQTGANEDNRRAWGKQDGVNPEQEHGVNHWVIQFNKWIRDVYVPQLQKAGKKVVYVDVYAKFILPDGTVRGWSDKEPERTHGPAAYGDYGLHPNQFGYQLMGEAWTAAIVERLPKK